MYAGLETLFLGPKNKDSHTISFFTPLRGIGENMFLSLSGRLRNRKARQEANRLKGKAKDTSKGQGKTKSMVSKARRCKLASEL